MWTSNQIQSMDWIGLTGTLAILGAFLTLSSTEGSIWVTLTLVAGPRCLVIVSRCLVSGSRCLVAGPRCLVSGPRCVVAGPRYLVARPQSLFAAPGVMVMILAFVLSVLH